MEKNYLFAYGFLKTEFHGNLKTKTPAIDGHLFGEGFYTGRIYQVDAYPGVIYDPSLSPHVKGEIFLLNNPDRTLSILDKYEHAKPLITSDPDYERVLRPIHTASGIIECWVYEYLLPIDPGTELLKGEFKPHTFG